MRIKNQAEPATPDSGYVRVYADTADKHLKTKDDAGTVVDLVPTLKDSFSGADGVKVITIPDGLYSGDKTATAVDADLVVGNIKKDVVILGVTGSLLVPELHSGQTTVYDADGDDATNDGTAKDYTDNSDGTVTDNHTGLVWQKDHKDDGATLTWAAAIDYAATLENGVDGLTDGSSTGDWRVPSNVELITLADYGYPDIGGGTHSYLNSIFTQTGWNSTCYGYWSSTTVPSSTSTAYGLYSGGGDVTYVDKPSDCSYAARCVRDA